MDPTDNNNNHQEHNRKARRRRLTERLQTLRERTSLLEQELSEYTSMHFRVCIFGSARITPDDGLYQTTQALACLLGREGIDVLTGGGPGLMEAANRGLQEGKEETRSKSKSFGISIDLGAREFPNEHLDIKHHHKKFSSRLDDFMRLSNAVIVTHGGIGTLLELFFSWQLIQVGHLTPRPIILLDTDFWKGLIDWMQRAQVAGGLVSPGDLSWIHLVETPAQAMSIICAEHEKFRTRQAQKAIRPE